MILCGGNIDTTVLGRCLERGLAADGRLARFTVRLPDRAGSVAGLTKFLFEQNARFEPTCSMSLRAVFIFVFVSFSVKDIEHERTWLNGSIFEVEVRQSNYSLFVLS